MALSVQGGVGGAVDVGGDDAVEVAPADDEAHRDAALVDAFGVVGRPDDGVGDAGVDAQGAEEGAGVADSGGGSEEVSWMMDLRLCVVEGRGEGEMGTETYPATSMEKPAMPRKELKMLQRPR